MIQYKLIQEYPGSPKLGSIHSEEHHLFRGIEYYDSFPEFWKKVPAKTPLFTTEDGVEIRIDDVYYAIEYDFKIVEYYLCSTPNGDKQFSTKEEAEKWVLLNKPCLSIMEVAPIFGQMHLDNSPDVLTRNLAKLKSLVQAKL